MSRTLLLASLVLSAITSCCASEPEWRSTPIGLGNRVRVTIEGTDIPSILDQDHFAYFVVDRPDGDPVPCQILIMETGSAPGASLVLWKSLEMKLDGVTLSSAESLPLDTMPANQSHDVILPDGWHLSLRQGDTYVFRVVDGKMIVDDKVQLGLWASGEGNTSYLRTSPAPSAPLPRAAEPDGWPAQR